MTFDEAAKLLFHANYSTIEETSNMPVKDIFIWPHGFCKRITGIIDFDELMITTTGPDLKVFITDPGRSLQYKISETSQTGPKIYLDSGRMHRFFSVKVVEEIWYRVDEDCTEYGPDKDSSISLSVHSLDLD